MCKQKELRSFNLELIATICLFIALKLDENRYSFSWLAQRASCLHRCTTQQLCVYERYVLASIDFNFSTLTPYDFLSAWLALLFKSPQSNVESNESSSVPSSMISMPELPSEIESPPPIEAFFGSPTDLRPHANFCIEVCSLEPLYLDYDVSVIAAVSLYCACILVNWPHVASEFLRVLFAIDLQWCTANIPTVLHLSGSLLRMIQHKYPQFAASVRPSPIHVRFSPVFSDVFDHSLCFPGWVSDLQPAEQCEAAGIPCPLLFELHNSMEVPVVVSPQQSVAPSVTQPSPAKEFAFDVSELTPAPKRQRLDSNQPQQQHSHHPLTPLSSVSSISSISSVSSTSSAPAQFEYRRKRRTVHAAAEDFDDSDALEVVAATAPDVLVIG